MGRAHLVILFFLIVGIVGCDHATKQIAQEELRNAPDVELVSGVLDLTYTENRDVGFSVLRSIPYEIRHPLVLTVGLLAIPLYLLIWFYRRRGPWYEHLGFAVIVAGAIGNVFERLFRGFVIDFIHLHHWPVFNVADICLVVGVGLIILKSPLLRRPRSSVPG